MYSVEDETAKRTARRAELTEGKVSYFVHRWGKAFEHSPNTLDALDWWVVRVDNKDEWPTYADAMEAARTDAKENGDALCDYMIVEVAVRCRSYEADQRRSNSKLNSLIERGYN